MPKVYQFKKYDPQQGEYKLSSFKAPMQLIAQEKAVPLLETEELVEEYLVKDADSYRLVS